MTTRNMDLELVQKFLIYSGFLRCKGICDHADIWWHRGNKDELVLPNSRAPLDWRQATDDAINKLISWGYFGEGFDYLLRMERMDRIKREMKNMVISKPQEFYRAVK